MNIGQALVGIIGDSAPPVYPKEIANSALFDGSTDYLSRTPSVGGDRKTWTFSWWGKTDVENVGLLGCGVDTNTRGGVALTSANKIQVYMKQNGTTHTNVIFNDELSDPTADYHIVVVYDSTQATESDRIQAYVNGVRLTDTTSPTYPSLDRESPIMDTHVHTVGAWYNGSPSVYYNGYLSDVYLIDGQALPASTWGEFSDLVTGLWVPKDPGSLSFGVNGVHLDFANSGALGNDVSGNNNHYTVNGTPEQTLDGTNNYATLNPLARTLYGSATDGNLAYTHTSSTSYGCIVGTTPVKAGKIYYEMVIDNLATTASTGLSVGWGQTDNVGKLSPIGNTHISATSKLNGVALICGGDAHQGKIYYSDTFTASFGTFANSDVVGVALDADTGEMWWSKNGAWLQGDPATGTSPMLTFPVAEGGYIPAVGGRVLNEKGTIQFGATGFTYTPPDSFKSLCTANLPDPTILKSSTVADLVPRVGAAVTAATNQLLNSSNTQSQPQYSSAGVSNLTDGTNGSYADGWYNHPGTASNSWAIMIPPVPFAMNKYTIEHYNWGGGTQNSHNVTGWRLSGSNDGVEWTELDFIRGESNTNDVSTYYFENTTVYSRYKLNDFTSVTGGVIIGEMRGYDTNIVTKILTPDMEGGPDFVNMKGRDFVDAWGMFDTTQGDNKYLRTSSTGAQNTLIDGFAFTPTGYELGTYNFTNKGGANFLDLCLAAGVDQGFEIVTWTGESTVAKNIPHNLGKAPTFIIVKNLSDTKNWTIYHAALGATMGMTFTTAAASLQSNWWNNTEPTATQFTVGSNNNVNFLGDEYIAYLFTDSDIFKAFSYTGNGNADGPFVNLGGKPLSIPFWKDADAVRQWYNIDTVRNPFNPTKWKSLDPGASSAESEYATNTQIVTAQGLKVATSNGDWNTSGELYVGLAILESTKYSNAF